MGGNMESPEYIKTSMAAAMTLGLKPGRFYRNAKLYCINLLETYNDGCLARCAYCGLNKIRPGRYEKKSFIRVDWPIYPTPEVVKRMEEKKNDIKRVCISMITHRRAQEDLIAVTERIREAMDIPISALITPTLLSRDDLADMKNAGVDRLGIAIDLATEELFEKYRGPVHKWEKYWTLFEDGLEIFGERMVGSHFLVGMGETEKEMTDAIQRVYDIGGLTHLFSFFPEENSELANHPQPPIDQYRRIQIARYLIDEGLSKSSLMEFDKSERIVNFGVSKDDLEEIIDCGIPFMTSGCLAEDGTVACNRPFANSLPGPDFRNFPFIPTPSDVERVRKELYKQ
ncbi:radical SAM protein [candidate division WOR-3 bacterium]|nr:radical SAM protein [candidate division WOR-3 bacterium]